MKTVLLAWELGANLGHAAPLLRLAGALRESGLRPVMALRDVVGAQTILAAAEIEIFQAPLWPRPGFPRGRPHRISNYTDNLALFGFAEPAGLAAMVRAWDNLLNAIQPDLVVCDHSPTLALAAFGAIPAAIIGNGYAVPPVHLPSFPPLYRDRPALIPETRILETVATVQQRRGRPAPATLPALFDAPLRAVLTFPELDPYRAVRREPVLGPLEPMPAMTELPADPRVFAYLGEEHPQIEWLVENLLGLNCALEVYLRGDVAVLRRVLASRGAHVHDRPPPLTEAVPRASLVVSHAGLITAHAALTAGRPQAVFPTHVEQELTAESLTALGVGVTCLLDADRNDISHALHKALDDATMRDAAQLHATEAARRPPLDALACVRDACLKLMR